MKTRKKSVFFPILLDIQNYPVLVIGGGDVALRKVEVLLKFTNKITILSPRVCDPLSYIIRDRKLDYLNKNYSAEYLKDFKVVISATNSKGVNQKVSDDCRERGIIVNVVDTPDLCDFILPAVIKRDDLTISISSQGRAPFMVKEIKQRLEHVYSDVYSDIVKLAGKFRDGVLLSKKLKLSGKKTAAFNKFLTIDWKRLIRDEGNSKANKVMKQMLKEVTK